MKVAIGTSSFAQLDDTPIKILQDAGIEIIPNPFGRKLTETEIIEHLKGVDGLIAGLEPLNSNVLNSAGDLKAIARVGIGMDNVDQKIAKDLKIKVSNTPDGPTYSVAEMTVASLLTLVRDIVYLNDELHNNRWTKKIGMGLRDAKILIIGFGRIGRKTKDLLSAFGATFLVYDPYLSETDLGENVRKVELYEGLRDADIISLHAAGETEILGKSEFALMKEGVILLNSARGALICEDAMIEALDSGKIKGAWLDAFWKEPYNGRLQEYNNVLLTPHVGTYTKQCRSSMEMAAVQNILRDLGVDK